MSKQSEQARQLVNYYVDQLSGWSLITTRPLFGAVALYRNDHVFAMVWQGALYFKVDDHTGDSLRGSPERGRHEPCPSITG